MHYFSQSVVVLLIEGLYLCLARRTDAYSLQTPLLDEAATSSQHKALVEADIIPDVLDDFSPSVSISLSYSAKHKHVKLGNSIKPKHVQSRPNAYIRATNVLPTKTKDNDATFVLALTDPDATSHSDPVKAQMCHWIVANITIPSDSDVSIDAFDLSSLFLRSQISGSNGVQEIMPYVPPTPPPKTGYHRYVFVVLTTDPAKNTTQLEKPKDRPRWGYGKIGSGVREWAEDNDLTVVGANFFYSRNKKQ